MTKSLLDPELFKVRVLDDKPISDENIRIHCFSDHYDIVTSWIHDQYLYNAKDLTFGDVLKSLNVTYRIGSVELPNRLFIDIILGFK